MINFKIIFRSFGDNSNDFGFKPSYRAHAVLSSQSQHLLPDAFLVSQYMQKLTTFINPQHPPKNDLIKVAWCIIVLLGFILLAMVMDVW